MMALVNNFTDILTDNLTVIDVYPSIRSPNSVTMGLLKIILPALGVFIIIMNLAVVISSGLILKTKKYRGNVFTNKYMYLQKFLNYFFLLYFFFFVFLISK